MKNLITASMLLLSSLSAAAFDFTYNYDDKNPSGFGYGIAEQYDACILIKSKALEGLKITGFSVPLPEGGTISPEVYAWVASKLPDNPYPATGDLANATATITDGNISVSFSEPAVIPASGAYIGYSLSATDVPENIRRFPISVVPSQGTNTLWLRASKSQQNWTDASRRYSYSSAMTVYIDGNLPQDAAQIQVNYPDYEYLVASDGTVNINTTISNHGSSPISSITYKSVTGDKASSATIPLSTPIPAKFGASANIEIPVEGDTQTGYSDATITITDVNGNINPDPQSSADVEIRSLPFLPVNRPLVEEYTGLWCGNCPSGYVALEQGAQRYGSAFTSVAFHYNDQMQFLSSFPSRVNSYPTMFINRGKATPISSMHDTWQERSHELAPAEINVDIHWTDESKTELRATANVRFLENDNSGHLAIGYILVADHLCEPSWGQANYYSGTLNGGDFWEIFTNGGAYVYGLEYNSVACRYSAFTGVENSLPQRIVPLETYSHSYTFKTTGITNITNTYTISGTDNFRVIAYVVDSTTGTPVNTASSISSSSAGVASVSAPGADSSNATIISSRYYDFTGRLLPSAPIDAPCIRVDIHSDGTTTTTKHLPR